MNTKLFVGNLDYSVSEVELRDTFLKCGEIDSVAVIMDRDTGRPRGFAFVEYTNAADAQRAVETLNGVELNGRAMNVSIARERERSGGGGGFGGGRERSGGGGGGGFGGGRSGGGGYEGGRDRRGGGDRNDRRSGGRW